MPEVLDAPVVEVEADKTVTKKTRKPRKPRKPKTEVVYQDFKKITGKKSRVGPKVVTSADGAPVATVAETFVSGPELSVGELARGIRSEHNLVDQKSEGGDRVAAQSTTERRMFETVNNTITFAEDVAKRWHEKEKKLSKTVYQCPFCDPRGRDNYDTPAAARNHIKESHPAALEMKKLQKAPPETYEPIQGTISPKRTLADFAPANQVERIEKMQKAHADLQVAQSRQQLHKSTEIQAASLLMKPEYIAVNEVRKLSDKELIVLVRLAFARDKRMLLKVSRNICKERKIAPPF